MPIEYYLAAGVAIIVLVLLVFALTGKKSKRIVVQKNPGTDELTRQVARAADALEALLAQLKALPPQVAMRTVPQAPVRPAPPARAEEVTVRTAEIRTVEAAPEAVNPAPAAAEPAVSEAAVTVASESVAAEEDAPIPQKPRRVKLSMFGR